MGALYIYPLNFKLVLMNSNSCCFRLILQNVYEAYE